MQIRPYSIADRDACLNVFRSNVPRYFGVDEEAEFAAFLLDTGGAYYVLLDGEQVIGCGGYHVSEDRLRAGLTWGMVMRERHGAGLGRLLLIYRLGELWQHAPHAVVVINTSQHTAPFFEKHGFVSVQMTRDKFAPGLHEVIMVLVPRSAGLQVDQDAFPLG